jgi:O-antigen/teichoic acid export membrane protein
MRGAFGAAASANLVAAALGMVFWVLAARSLDPSDIGAAGAVIALCVGLGSAATGGLHQVLLRVLPGHCDPQRLLAVASVSVAVAAAVLGAGAAALGLAGDTVVAAPLVVALGAALWAVFTMQDGVLLALSQLRLLVAGNLANAVGKIVLVVIVLGTLTGPASASQLVIAWLIPLAVVVPTVAVISRRRSGERSHDAASPIGVTRGHLGSEYLSSLSTLAVTSGVPVLLASVAGVKLAGTGYPVWMLFVAADAVGSMLASTVVVAVAAGRRSLQASLLDTRILLGCAAAAAAVAAFAAPAVLAVLGSDHSAAVGMLRWCILATLIRAFAHLALAACRVRRSHLRLVTAQAGFAGVALIGALVAARAGSLDGVGAAVAAAALTGLILAVVPVPQLSPYRLARGPLAEVSP